jgi:hypothetical protein
MLYIPLRPDGQDKVHTALAAWQRHERWCGWRSRSGAALLVLTVPLAWVLWRGVGAGSRVGAVVLAAWVVMALTWVTCFVVAEVARHQLARRTREAGGGVVEEDPQRKGDL